MALELDRRLEIVADLKDCVIPDAVARYLAVRLVIGVIGMSVALSACKSPGDSAVLLACTTHRDQIMDVVRLEPTQNRAMLLSVNPAREGTLTTSESAYDVVFPERPDEGAMRLHLSINRYTSHFHRDLGRPPHDAVTGVMPWTGICKPHKGARL